MFIDRLSSYFMGAFCKPFRGLVVIVWSFLFLVCLLLPDGPMRYGRFVDSDDVVHLTRVWDLLNGQGWFDPHLYRILPPDGMVTHFSRLAEIPLLLILWPLHALGVPLMPASFITMTVMPLVLMAVFLVVCRWAVKPLVGEEWAGVVPVVFFFAYPIISELVPARADHHALSAICVLSMMGFLFRLFKAPPDWKSGMGAGFFGALSVAVALETFPWVVALCGLTGLLLVVQGRVMASTSAAFGISLFVSSALFLAAMVAPEQYVVADSLTYSSLYVVCFGLLAGVFVVVAGASVRLGVVGRLALGIALAALAVAVFLWLFPSMLQGPFGSMDKKMADIMLRYLSLNVPMANKYESIFALLQALGVPIVGVFASFFFMTREKENAKIWMWCGYGGILMVGLLGVIYYQQRLSLLAHLVALPPVVVLLRYLWEDLGAFAGNMRFVPFVMLVLLIDSIPSTLHNLVVETPTEKPKEALPYAFSFGAEKDTSPSVWQTLSDPSGWGSKPRLVMNMMNECGPLLLFTPHRFLAAPYHMNVSGNWDSLHFFKTKSPEKARDIARKTDIDLVLISPRRTKSYKEAQVEENQQEATPDFGAQLVDGQVPDWLKRVPASDHNDQYLFEVVKDRL